ncbi:MAG TPA: phosphopantetheine-binding protein [Luteibacter sp.]|uniref:phosphopantetheine-binding protein n=1 Tax=Luteibacter sp. TaxID=1886636 RepID=UPI002C3BC442|nr:phosphopantetheine-binding protein [Luteibacter sp.]HVI56417.1 phosphopantetheine-binding protein [Luteibacter sp.]
MTADAESRVLDIVAAQSGKDRATLTTASTLKELEVDSLEAIEIVFEIEEAFGIQLAQEQGRLDTETLQSLVDAVNAALAEPGRSAAAS